MLQLKAVEKATCSLSIPFCPQAVISCGYLGQTKGGRWNGRYTVTWPDGTKRTRDIYADTAEECEKLLTIMITEMKTEVAAEKERLRTENKAS